MCIYTNICIYKKIHDSILFPEIYLLFCKQKKIPSLHGCTSIIISNVCCMQLTAFQVHLRESVGARASSTIQQHRWLSQHALR